MYVRSTFVSVPWHSTTSSVKEPEMLWPFIVEVIVNTVLASGADATPWMVQLAASSVRPAGSAGWRVQVFRSASVGWMSASW